MKKLAILGSAKSCVLEAILKYFEGKDIEITCLSDDEHSEFYQKAKKIYKNTILLPHEMNFEYFSSHDFDLVALCDYRQYVQSEALDCCKFISIHGSLLPSFKGPDAINRAFTSGVKVSGVTVHWVNEDVDSGTIIAQYPVLIENLMHFDEYEENIYKLEELLYPIVIDKVLKDEVFDFQDLLNHGNCSRSCDNCGGCH